MLTHTDRERERERKSYNTLEKLAISSNALVFHPKVEKARLTWRSTALLADGDGGVPARTAGVGSARTARNVGCGAG